MVWRGGGILLGLWGGIHRPLTRRRSRTRVQPIRTIRPTIHPRRRPPPRQPLNHREIALYPPRRMRLRIHGRLRRRLRAHITTLLRRRAIRAPRRRGTVDERWRHAQDIRPADARVRVDAGTEAARGRVERAVNVAWAGRGVGRAVWARAGFWRGEGDGGCWWAGGGWELVVGWGLREGLGWRWRLRLR